MVQLVNFYYDIACPYSYVVTYALRRLLCRSDVVVNWKPVYFGRYHHYLDFTDEIEFAGYMSSHSYGTTHLKFNNISACRK